MASSFGWKRKRKSVGSNASAVFKNDSDSEVEEKCGKDGRTGSLTVAKKRCYLLEDNLAKSKRLQDEGTLLAESGRYWEALKYWHEALECTPGSAVLHEMKSQVLLELGELFPAVAAASKAVTLEPTWAMAWQTLGRAQIGLGEVGMALSSAQKSVHLDPTNEEVWEDVKWAKELVQLNKAKFEVEDEGKRDVLEKRTSLSSN